IKDEFLAILSHELRTPLQAILGLAKVLRTASTSARDLDRCLEIIERNAQVQTQIIEDLLDMSRVVSENVRLEVQSVDLNAIVKSAIESVRPAAEAKDIRMRTVLDPLAGAEVRGDRNLIQQIVWNLLSNAIKFTPKGGSVEVAVERADS